MNNVNVFKTYIEKGHFNIGITVTGTPLKTLLFSTPKFILIIHILVYNKEITLSCAICSSNGVRKLVLDKESLEKKIKRILEKIILFI